MDKDQMHHRDPEDDELTRRLEAYAEARLSPELSATSRMRNHVMAAAHRHAVLARADADRAAAVAAAAAQADRPRRSTWRRPMTALLAAGLTLGVGVSSVAAAQPGGPLYGVRIWTETLTLPTSAAERAKAEVRRLEERLVEAAAATAAGDTNAANAALEAYGAIVSEATTGADVSAAATATLDAGIRRNIQVLRVLAGRVPDTARDAIEQAIERSGSALDAVHEAPAGGPPPITPANSPKPGASDRPSHSPNPNKPPPDPNATPKLHEVTPGADDTPKPEKTPPAGPPSYPPGNGDGGGGGNSATETQPNGGLGD